jgi:type VI secretion system protein ImpL
MKKVLTNWWFVSGVAVLLAVLLLCFGLPLFVDALRPWWVRLILFLLVAGTWGLLAFLRMRKARKGAEALATELAQPDASAQEDAQLSKRMAEALTTLRSSAGAKNRDYLYSRPWYVIIGPPGAGKTTALVRSGLRFPFSDQALRGVGGTRNLDFLFADEAVLVDTAGRYTSQDSDASADAQGWSRFLALLKKNRPLQPINGIIVAIGVDELVRGDRQSIDGHALAVRRRLHELRRELEVKAPIYLLLTKADLLAGFVEYFEDLDVEGRRAVLGHTFPYDPGKPNAERLVGAFDEMAANVSARQAKRLAEEPDAARRAMLLGFPSQLTSLRSRLMRFLEGAFASGDEPAGVLRGFYLTSGVQEGAPLDRIISSMAQVYDQPHQAGREAGRAYFLNRLLTEVMFPEAGMVQSDPAARKRQRTALAGSIAAIGVVSLLVLVAWTVSFFGNRGFQADLLGRANAATGLIRDSGIDLKEVKGDDASLDRSLDALNSLRALPGGYAERRAGGPPLSMRFGLYQTSHSRQAEESYREGLRRILLPRLLLQLEQSLAANFNDPLAIYEPLKVYLMLGGQGPLDRKSVGSWAETYWANQAYPGADQANMRKQLAEHLTALLEDENMSAAWEARRAPLDGQLIASARTAVQQLSMAERAYAIMRQKALAAGGRDWVAANTLVTGHVPAFANGEDVRALTVPHFFTRGGYETAYQAGLASAQSDLKKDLWVMGGDANTAAMQQQMGGVRAGVAQLYARDYIAAWDGVIAALQPADYFRDRQAMASLIQDPSPLKLILAEVRANTSFAGGSAAAKAMAGQAIAQRLGRAAALAPAGQGFDAGQEISAHFKPISDYVGDGRTPAPIDELLKALRQADQAIRQAELTGGGPGSEAAQVATAQAVAMVQQAATLAPGQIQGLVGAVAQSGGTARVSAASGAVADEYAQAVLPACRAVTQERYPFYSASANELSPVEAQRVFGLGGTIDQFVATRLTPLLDTSGPVWRWREGDPVAASLDPASPAQFARAMEVRDLIAGGLVVRVELASLQGADSVAFQSGDAVHRFDPTAKGPKQIRWSAQGGSPEASVTLYKAGQQTKNFSEGGVWALFRLMDQARRENAGPSAFLATFEEGGQGATFRFTLTSERNPFGKGGLWTFRCPVQL